MAYDEELADRVREALAGEPDVSEKRMFGGLAFLLGGKMAIAVSGSGGLMARVDPAERADLLTRDGVGPMVMRGSETAGWVRVDPHAVAADAELRSWVDRGAAVARNAG